MRRDRWSPEREVRLVELVGQSLTASEIAERLGVTRQAVKNKAHRMRLRLNKYARMKTCVQAKGHILRPSIIPFASRPAPFWGLCQWIHGDQARGPVDFCGAPAMHTASDRFPNNKLPYCEKHARLAYERIP